MHEKELKAFLASCIEVYFQKGKVFDKWFFENSSSYFFLFKKNLKVTNIQYAELISLIQLNATRNGKQMGSEILFLSVNEFNQSFREILATFLPENLSMASLSSLEGMEYDLKSLSLEIADYLIGLLSNIVVVDTFYGSCAVYLPPNIEVDISTMCGLSGYIHSCGRNLYTRNITKAKKPEFLNAIGNYLSSNKSDKKKFFAVYAHEDFSSFDREVEEELKNGLDDVKIHVEKYHMGIYFLVSILKTMDEKFNSELVIPYLMQVIILKNTRN